MKNKKTVAIVCLIFFITQISMNIFAESQPGNMKGKIGANERKIIEEWISSGLTYAKTVEKFNLDGQITKAEFVAFLNRIFGYSEKAEAEFKDVEKASWYYNDIEKAVAAGIIRPEANDLIRPLETIDRQEAAQMIYNAFSLKLSDSKCLTQFKDSGLIDEAYKDAFAALVENGIIKGYSNKNLGPLDTVTRVQAVIMLNRAFGTLYNKKGIYTGYKSGNVVVNTSDVNLKDMTITGDLYLIQGIGDGEVSLDNVVVNGRTIVCGGGQNSIVIKNSSLKGVLVVKKEDGKIRILTLGSTNISHVEMLSGGKLEEKDLTGAGFTSVSIFEVGKGKNVILNGDFSNVSLETSDVSVDIIGGNIEKLDVQKGASGMRINLASGTKVGTLTVNAPIAVTGSGEISNAVINAQGVTIQQKPKNVQFSENVTAIIGGVNMTGKNSAETDKSRPATSPEQDRSGISDSALNNAYVDSYYSKTFGTAANTLNTDTSKYAAQYELNSSNIQSLKIKNSDFPDQNIFSTIGGLLPKAVVNGITYSADNNTRTAKAWIRKAGKVLWEIQINDIILKSGSGDKLPLTVQQTYNFWDDKFYVTTKWLPTENITNLESATLNTRLNGALFDKYNVGDADRTIPQDGVWSNGTILDGVAVFDSKTQSHGAFAYEIINKTGTESLNIASFSNQGNNPYIEITQSAYDKNMHNGNGTVWKSGHAIYTYTQFFADGENGSSAALNDIAAETHPLNAGAFSIKKSFPYEGSKSLGYDNTTGAYVVEVYTPDDSKINYYKDYPNDYPSVEFQIVNDNIRRTFRLQTQMAITGANQYAPGVTGSVAMLTDKNLVPNGIPVQVSKKWDNLDTTRMESYNNSYAAFSIKPNGIKTMWHRTSFQNWGNKVNVGLPSLELTNYYNWGYLWLETNVGMSESMTYLPDNDNNATMCDFRAQDGMRLEGDNSPWFANAGGLEFLQLKDGDSWIDAKRRGTGIRFDSLGPNVSEFSMELRTPDGKPDVKVSVTSTLLPSINGTRIFYQLHYDFLSDIRFTDIKKELSLFSMGDTRYATSVVHKMAYKNSDGTVSTLDINSNNTWNVNGQALYKDKPWVAFYQSETNNVGFVVDSFKGKINGTEIDQAAVSMYAGIKPTAYLVPNTDSNQIKAGDSIDLMVEAYTWKNSDDYSFIQNEAAMWPTAVSVTKGKLISQFPAKVDAADNAAEFTIKGGVDYVPVTVKGFDSYSEPELKEYTNGEWVKVDQSVGIKDYWQTDIDEETGKYDFTYILPADSNEHKYKVSLAKAAAPDIPAASPRLQSEHAFITAFDVAERVSEPVIDEIGTVKNGVSHCAITIDVGASTDITNIVPDITVSENAAVSPASGIAQDFTLPVDYTVTAEDGITKRIYTVTVKRQFPVEKNAITGFSMDHQVELAVIDPFKHTVLVKVSHDADLTNLTPALALSEDATVLPASGVKQDFTNPFTYTVMSKEGESGSWTVTVEKMAPNLAVNGTYDGTIPNYGPAYVPGKAFDNNLKSKWAPTGLANQWISVDFGKKTTFDNIVITEGSGLSEGLRSFREYVLQYSDDGAAWTDIPSTHITDGAPHSDGPAHLRFNFSEISANRVRLLVVQADGGIYLHEFAIYYNNDAKNITGFKEEQQAEQAVIDNANHTVALEVFKGADLAKLHPDITISNGASVSPASGTERDFTNPVTYTVTAADRSTQDWVVTVTKGNTVSNARKIKEFTMTEQMAPAVIDEANHIVTIQVPAGTDVTSLIPTITISPEASISPLSGAAQDYTIPVTYTVMAADGSTRDWVVTVEKVAVASSAKDITSFVIEHQAALAVIDVVYHTISVQVYPAADITALVPTITVSDKASVTPLSGAAHDFTLPAAYIVIAEDGSTQQWTINVSKQYGTNLASGKTYDGSTPTWGDQWYGPDKAFDGDTNSKWAPQGLADQWISMDFGALTTFNTILLNEGDEGPRYLINYVLQYHDGTNWIDIPGTSVTDGASHSAPLIKVFSFNPLTADKLRLKINQAGGGIYLHEMGVYNIIN